MEVANLEKLLKNLDPETADEYYHRVQVIFNYAATRPNFIRHPMVTEVQNATFKILDRIKIIIKLRYENLTMEKDLKVFTLNNEAIKNAFIKNDWIVLKEISKTLERLKNTEQVEEARKYIGCINDLICLFRNEKNLPLEQKHNLDELFENVMSAVWNMRLVKANAFVIQGKISPNQSKQIWDYFKKQGVLTQSKKYVEKLQKNIIEEDKWVVDQAKISGFLVDSPFSLLTEHSIWVKSHILSILQQALIFDDQFMNTCFGLS